MVVTPLQLFFCALGLAFILEGMLYFLFPLRIKKLLENLEQFPPTFLRNMGLWIIIIGLIIVYFSIH